MIPGACFSGYTVLFLAFQAVCQRKGDRCDGPEADRTLLWRGALQRTQSLQVAPTHLAHMEMMVYHLWFINRVFLTFFTATEGSLSAQYWTGRMLFLTETWTKQKMPAGETDAITAVCAQLIPFYILMPGAFVFRFRVCLDKLLTNIFNYPDFLSLAPFFF